MDNWWKERGFEATLAVFLATLAGIGAACVAGAFYVASELFGLGMVASIALSAFTAVFLVLMVIFIGES